MSYQSQTRYKKCDRERNSYRKTLIFIYLFTCLIFLSLSSYPLILDLFLFPNNFCNNNFLLSSDINLEDGVDASSISI